MRRLLIVSLLAIAATASAQSPARDSVRRAALAGTVRDSAGQPLPRATVTALGRDATAITDIDGRFHIGGLPSGTTQFTAMRLGFTAVSFEATLSPDSTLVIDLRMRPAQQLPEVTVSRERVSPRLARDGFYDRQEKGWGQYLTPDQIERLSHYSTPAQMLRDVPGLRVDCGASARRATTGCVVRGGGGACMTLFVDGVYTRGELDQRLSTGQVYAVETYSRSALVPQELNRPVSEGRCGAIVVWTQSRKP